MIILSLQKSQRQFSLKKKSILLKELEKQGVFPEYQCRAGFCGACRTKLIQGKISYSNPPLAYVQKDEILLCCASAESDVLLDL